MINKKIKKINKKNKKKNIINSSKKKILRTIFKKFMNYLKNKNKKNINLYFKYYISLVDKLSNKKIIHKNKGKRYKKRIYFFLNNYEYKKKNSIRS